MSGRDYYLNQIYELIKIQSRELTIDQLSDELGISRRWLDRIIEISKDDVDKRGWMVGAVGYKDFVTVWDGCESSPDQKDRKERSLETSKRRIQRSIHIGYHQLNKLVAEIGKNHPEFAYWDTQLAYAKVMRDAAERFNQ